MTEAQVEHEAISCKFQYIPPIVDLHTNEGQTERQGLCGNGVLRSHFIHYARILRAPLLQVSVLK